MSRKLHTKLFTALAVGLAVAVIAPIASAKSPPQGKVTIPTWLARTQYPGTSPEPTALVNNAGLPVSHCPCNTGPPGGPGFPGTSSEPTILVDDIHDTGRVGGGFDWVSALIGACGGLGIAVAGAGSVMALRKRRTFAHV